MTAMTPGSWASRPTSSPACSSASISRIRSAGARPARRLRRPPSAISCSRRWPISRRPPSASRRGSSSCGSTRPPARSRGRMRRTRSSKPISPAPSRARPVRAWWSAATCRSSGLGIDTLRSGWRRCGAAACPDDGHRRAVLATRFRLSAIANRIGWTERRDACGNTSGRRRDPVVVGAAEEASLTGTTRRAASPS